MSVSLIEKEQFGNTQVHYQVLRPLPSILLLLLLFLLLLFFFFPQRSGIISPHQFCGYRPAFHSLGREKESWQSSSSLWLVMMMKKKKVMDDGLTLCLWSTLFVMKNVWWWRSAHFPCEKLSLWWRSDWWWSALCCLCCYLQNSCCGDVLSLCNFFSYVVPTIFIALGYTWRTASALSFFTL